MCSFVFFYEVMVFNLEVSNIHYAINVTVPNANCPRHRAVLLIMHFKCVQCKCYDARCKKALLYLIMLSIAIEIRHSICIARALHKYI